MANAHSTDDVLGDLVRVTAKRVADIGLTPRRYRTATGRYVSKESLYKLREGNPERYWSFPRLARFAESLGLEVYVGVLERPVPSAFRRSPGSVTAAE